VSNRVRGESVQTEIGAVFQDSDFVLKFEPGTIVWDARTWVEYRVRDDGSKAIIKQHRKPALPK
jgi:hypothetical protein